MKRFECSRTPLAGLVCVQRQRLSDARGLLSRIFCADELSEAGWTGPVAQINHTATVQRGSLRGLHFQHAPHAESKLVSCLRGAVWDVAVDLRRGSPTFLQWHGQELSATGGMALLIPPGFAHGFQTLEDDVEMLYCHSAAYAAHAEGGLHANDPALALPWPIPVTAMSARDAAHPFLQTDFKGLSL